MVLLSYVSVALLVVSNVHPQNQKIFNVLYLKQLCVMFIILRDSPAVF